MKKIILTALTVLTIFGLVGCNGVLHDEKPFVPEKVTIEGGSWFYYDVTVWGDNDGNTAQLIINDGSVQSPDTKLPAFEAKTGAALYFTMKKADLKLNVSYQDDEPEYTPVPGTVRIYVYTDITAPNAYYWGGNFAGPNWPGFAMTKNGEVAAETYDATATLASITITGLPAELNGKTLYLTGSPMVWAAPGTSSTRSVVVADGKIALTDLGIELNVAGVNVGKIGSAEMKFAAEGWAKPEVTAAGGSNFKVNVVDGETINLVGVYTGTKADSGDDAQVYCCLFAQ